MIIYLRGDDNEGQDGVKQHLIAVTILHTPRPTSQEPEVLQLLRVLANRKVTTAGEAELRKVS